MDGTEKGGRRTCQGDPELRYARLGRRPFLVFDEHRIFDNSAVIVVHSTGVYCTLL